MLFDVANVELSNCILLMDPATTTVDVAAPITVSGAGCSISSCRIRQSTDADNVALIPITVTGDDFTFSDNFCYGALLGLSTTFMDINAAHRLIMTNNYFSLASTATGVGIVRFVTGASLDVFLQGNTYINILAASAAAVTGLANVTGVSRDEHFSYLDNASLTGWLTSVGKMTFHRPTVTNAVGETGSEVVGAVSA